MKTTLSLILLTLLLSFGRAEVAFVSTESADNVVRISSSGTTTVFAGTGLTNPKGVAFDRASNCYVANFFTGTGDGTVVMLPAGGGAPVPLASGLNGPTGVAVDEDGNVYAAISADARIIKITAPAVFTTFATLAVGANPQGIAFSPEGELFVANKGTNTISRVSAGGGVTLFSDDVTAPTGVAFTKSGNIFAVHGGASGVIARFNPNGNAMNHVTGFNDPRALAIDGDGNFYVVNGGDNTLKLVSASKTVSQLGEVLAVPQFVATRGPRIELVAIKGETLTTDPAGTKFHVLSHPAIAETGDVAYRATLLGGISGVNATNANGIWRDAFDGTRTLIARQSFPAPGTTDANFLTFSDPVINSSGEVAFRATLKGKGAPAGKTIGLWTDVGGTLHLAVRQGDQPMGVSGTAKYVAFSSLVLADDGDLVFQATIAGQGVTAANNLGLWAATPGGLQLILRKGQLLTGNPSDPKVLSFTAFRTVPFALGQNRTVASDGGVTVLAVLSDRSTALLRVNGGTVTVVARKGEILTSNPVGAKLAAIFSPALAANADVVWRSSLTPGLAGVISTNASCIFHQNQGGTRSLLARATFPAGGTNGAVFAAFSDPVVNATGQVAFRATLKTNVGDAVVGKTFGLWSNSHGALTVVARQGDRPPGLGNGVKFTAFNSYVLPNEGGVVTFATVAGSGITASNNQGIWAVDVDGDLQRVIQKGDKLELGGSQKTVLGLKVFAALPFVAGHGRNYASNGDLAFLATFTDGTHAILRVVFP